MPCWKLRVGFVLATIASLIGGPLSVSAQDIGFERDLARQMLETVSGQVQRNFHNPELLGSRWKENTSRARNQIETTNLPSVMMNSIHSLLSTLQDSHTLFVPPKRTIERRFGFEAMAFRDDIRIHALVKDGPAETAGLQVGDRLLTLNGVHMDRDTLPSTMFSIQKIEPVDVLEVTYDHDDNRSRSVRVPVQVREVAALEFVTNVDDIYQVINETTSTADPLSRERQPNKEVFDYSKSEDGIAYLHLPSFLAENTILSRLINNLKEARAIILDLRGNAGGSIEAMQYLTGFFERDPTTIARMVGRKGTRPLKVKPRHPYLPCALFILIDSRTASAAEVFARHFQRTGRGTVIGDHSAGRVTASRIFSNLIGSKMVITYWVQVSIARIVFPGGEDLERTGVTPDYSCIPGPEELRGHRDVCYETAVARARKFLTQ